LLRGGKAVGGTAGARTEEVTMNGRRHLVAMSEFLHRHFLWFLLSTYAAAALWPAFGLWVKDVSLGQVPFAAERTRLTLPMVMLAVLLLNAGLGVQTSRLRDLLGMSPFLAVGLAANLLIPVVFIFGVTWALRPWHEPDEVQSLLVGLALVASMPVAGSSTAWSQNNNGDLALSLGLVLLSTLLSPLTTPAALHALGLMASGDHAAQLHRLAGRGTGGFLAVFVALPSLLGILGRWAAGAARVEGAKPYLKLANSVNLLLLNYANGAASLPQAVAEHDWDFLAVTLGISATLCVTSFTSGWWLGRLLEATTARRTALMFGLGMNNNGTGLVLAGVALAGLPKVMLPVILYNLVQHLVAGGATALLARRPAGTAADGGRHRRAEEYSAQAPPAAEEVLHRWGDYRAG
jgi:BASS family bile acid:Na+ symporter